MSLAFDGLTGQVTLIGKAGVTSCALPAGSPFVNVNVGADGVLAPGETVQASVTFYNPRNVAIGYTPRVLAGSGPR